MQIMGISAFHHDSPAALVRNAEIVVAAWEERFTRSIIEVTRPAPFSRRPFRTQPF
jgi:carbamoyltransferase